MAINRPWLEEGQMRSALVLDTDKTANFESPVESPDAPIGIMRRVGAFLLLSLIHI